MLAGNGQRLAVFLPVIEQIPLIAFERCSRDLGQRSDSTSRAPGQKHLHVHSAHSKRALAEALHGKMLQVLFQKYAKRLPGRSASVQPHRSDVVILLSLSCSVFFMLPPVAAIMTR